MAKDFDGWNREKKRLNDSAPEAFCNEREIWWCAFGVNVGVETDGKNDLYERPVLVIHKFNKDMFWGVPLTSQAYSSPFHCMVIHEGGLSWAIVSQIRVLSSKRLLRKMSTISQEDHDGVLKSLREFL